MKEIRNRDGTTVVFNEEAALQSISQKLSNEAGLESQEAATLAQNIITVLNDKFPQETVDQEVLDSLVEVVVLSAQRAKSESYPSQTPGLGQVSIENKDIAHLQEQGVYYSEQAKKILEESTVFDELGRSIFLDRYSVKSKRESIEVGDLVIAITKEDNKYPKKDLGIVKSKDGDDLVLHMITGLYADPSNKYEFNQSIWKCDKPSESIQDAHRRIADGISRVEATPELQSKWSSEFYEQLQKKHIQPAGRIMTGANRGGDSYTKNLTLFNCYVIPSPTDSRGGIVQQTLHQMIEIMSRGGGVGINLSSLRPRYSYVRGVHGKSSGAVSWGGLYSHATGLIEQGGSRRGALMLMLHDWHPDVEEFINAKRKKGNIENANISVLVSDRFMEALAQDGDWDLVFPDYEAVEKSVYMENWNGELDQWLAKGLPTKVYKTVKARDLWDQIIRSAHASAEPGVVFMERYNKQSNSWYFNPIICTNPCGEQGLPGWGVCNLGHLYLASFLKEVGQDADGPLYEIGWEELKKASRVLARFLDDVIDATPYHFQENEDNQKGERRVGGGTLGLGEMLIKLRLRYGSPESLEVIDKVYEVISTEMYKASAEIAEEKGAFPNFDAEKFLQSGFMQTMPEDVRELIREKGIRNVTLTTQAPTGTVGTMLGTSTGIEPYYAFEFFRQSRLGFHKVKIPLAEDYMKEDGTLPDYFITAMQMSPMDHVRVQAAVQKWTDSSISKTANAPQDFSVEETKELYEEAYRLGCKGVTIYRDNSRSEQVLSTDEKKGEQNAASSEAGTAEVAAVAETVTNAVPESSSESAPGAEAEVEAPVEQVQQQTYVQAEEMAEGKSCELKIDENGQMYKSCSE